MADRVQMDGCGSRRRGDNRLSLAIPAEFGHRIGVRTWQRNFRRFIPAKSCGTNFSARFDLETAEDVLAPQIKKIASYEAA
jgi:hypothetical protein